MSESILIVDDEEAMRISMAGWLREDGHLCEVASSGEEAVRKTRDTPCAIAFIDMKMPGGMDGIETTRAILEISPETAVVIVTAYATIDTAVTAMKAGAQEYLVKPVNPEEISLLVERLLRIRRIERENLLLREQLARQYSFRNIISKSPRMQEVFALIRDVAGMRSTILIQGDSGTGKDLVARAIHDCSDRADRPYVPVSCAALSETLLESELFGHERGAFTGAVSRRKGKFEIADGGTLFLDEIGDVSPKLQLDLLRVLQERRFYRVGGAEEVEVDVRVIAATKRDLLDAVQDGSFRDDLYYRLNVIQIRLPPLRERREDIPLLTRHFLERLGAELGKAVRGVSEGALGLLMAHDWPGNVRELQNAVERAIVTSKAPMLGEGDFAFLGQGGPEPRWIVPTGLSLSEVERQVIEATLAAHAGNVRKAAEVLGIDRSTLYERIKRYDIPRRSGDRPG